MAVSMCCAPWRAYPQHEDCRGWLWPDNRTDLEPVRCDCRTCKHPPLVESKVTRQRTATH